jgi:ethanolamine utilization protein EutM
MKALGMIEVYGYLAAIEALDSGLKAANVKLVDVTLVQGGLVTVLVNGDVGAVKAAMDASKSAAERVGKVVSVHVIPRPSQGIDKIINPYPLNIPCGEKEEENITKPNSYKPQSDNNMKIETSEKEVITDNTELSKTASVSEKEKEEIQIDTITLTPEKMQAMTVDRLRKLAREIRITNMTSKQIRFSTKNELIRSISEFIEQER